MIQLTKTSFLFFIALTLSSCFGPFKELKYQLEDSLEDSETFVDSPSDLKDLDNELNIIVESEFSSGKALKRNFNVTSNDTSLFLLSSSGTVTAVEMNSLNQLWQYEHNNEIFAGLSSNDNSIFFVDSNGFLISIDHNGKLVWKSFVGEVLSPPLSLNDFVYIKSTDNKILSLNTIDGSLKWSYNLPASSLTIRSWGQINYKKDLLFIGAPAGKVVCLNRISGSLVWETTYSQPKGPSELERSNDTTSKPIFDEDFIYVVASNGNLATLSLLDGGIVWSRPLSSFYGLSLTKESIFVTHNSGSIYALSKLDKVLWRNSDLQGRDVSKPFIFNNFVLVSDFDGYIHILDLVDGEIIARLKVTDSFIIEPIFAKDTNNLFLVSNDGEIFKISFQKFDDNNKNLTNNDSYSSVKDDENDSNTLSSNDSGEIVKSETILDSIIFWN